MNFDDFMHNANQEFIKHLEHQRYGQFLMNYLYEKYPEIEIPSEIDPFYDNSKIPDLIKYLHSIST
jgi:hypothetical protein